MPKALDKTDREIIRQFRLGERATNQQIAKALGLNAATVAARIRRMEANHQMRVVAVSDFATHGFECLLRIAIKAEERPLADIGRDVARFPETLAIHIVSGRHELNALLGLRAFSTEATRLLTGISRIRGIRHYSPSIILDVLKYHFDVAPISPGSAVPVQRQRRHSSSLRIDDLDLALIHALAHDARVTNERIARELNVTEGTVRSRIKRLRQRKLIAFTAVTSPEVAGMTHLALIDVEASGADSGRVARQLAAMPAINAVMLQTGRLNILAVCLKERIQDVLHLASNEIRSLKGVRDVETSIVIESVMHNSLMARLRV